MANIRLDLNHAPLDGESVTFKAPCDASQITGLVIYYANEANTTVSKSFTLTDANGGDIGLIDNVFSAGAIIKVLLDTDENKAFMQNPDTNTYLEGRFENKAPKKHTHTKSEISDFPSSMTPTSHASTHKTGGSDAITPADIGASATGHKHTKSEITDFPTSMTPTAHNQAASTITAGTFAGQVVASGQDAGTALLRNSKIVSADTNPTVNGEINWTFK